MKKLFTCLTLLGLLAPFSAKAQLQLKAEAPANPDNEPIEVHPVPHPRQPESQRQYKYVLRNMMKLQEAYNQLEASSISEDQVNELNETIVELRRQLAVEKRGMSYAQVSGLLEGANTSEEIESKLDSLSRLGRNRTSKVSVVALTESMTPSDNKLSGLASIISKV